MVPRAVRFVKKWYSIAIILYKTSHKKTFNISFCLCCSFGFSLCLSDRLVEQLIHIELLISLFD